MKRLLQLVFCVLLASAVVAALPENVQRAERDGATGTFRLKVVDDQGQDIKEVYGAGGFWDYRDLKYNLCSSKSDEYGELVLSSLCYYNGKFELSKEGYYKTSGEHVFFRDSEDAVEETLFSRKWVPDYVATVILKKIRNPIPMFAWSVALPIPQLDVPIGLDLEQMQWTPPHGEGQHPDVYLTFNSIEMSHGQRIWKEVGSMDMEFRNPMDGIQMWKQDAFSEFKSSYHVDTTKAFLGSMRLDRVRTNAGYRLLSSGDYLVFRTRSEISANGGIEKCHYGKIYPSIEASSQSVYFFAAYFNPTPNDTNLEFDPKQNLAPAPRREYRKRSRAEEP